MKIDMPVGFLEARRSFKSLAEKTCSKVILNNLSLYASYAWLDVIPIEAGSLLGHLRGSSERSLFV